MLDKKVIDFFLTFSDKVDRLAKLQNSDSKKIFDAIFVIAPLSALLC